MAVDKVKEWGPTGSGSASLVSFPQVTPIPSTLIPHPCPLALPPAHHWPIALSVFIDLGETGGGALEGHDTSGTTHSQRSAEQRARRTASGASSASRVAVAATGEREPLWACPASPWVRAEPGGCPAPPQRHAPSRGQPRGEGRGEKGLKGSMGRESAGQCSRPQHLPGVEEERSAQGRGTVRRHPGLPSAPAPSHGCRRRRPLGPVTGPLSDPYGARSHQPLLAPPSSAPPRTLAPPFHPCSLPSALCSMGSAPLSSWPHTARHPLSSPRSHLSGDTGLPPRTWASPLGGLASPEARVAVADHLPL